MRFQLDYFSFSSTADVVTDFLAGGQRRRMERRCRPFCSALFVFYDDDAFFLFFFVASFFFRSRVSFRHEIFFIFSRASRAGRPIDIQLDFYDFFFTMILFFYFSNVRLTADSPFSYSNVRSFLFFAVAVVVAVVGSSSRGRFTELYWVFRGFRRTWNGRSNRFFVCVCLFRGRSSGHSEGPSCCFASVRTWPPAFSFLPISIFGHFFVFGSRLLFVSSVARNRKHEKYLQSTVFVDHTSSSIVEISAVFFSPQMMVMASRDSASHVSKSDGVEGND